MTIRQRIRKVMGDIYKAWTLHHLYPSKYRKYAKQPVDPRLIVFLEIRQKQLSDNFREIYHMLEAENKYDLKLCCIQEGMTDRTRVRKNCLAVLEDLARAKIIFINDSSYLIGCLPLRSETQVIQTWHACGAFKRFGYSVADKLFGSNQKDLERFPLHRNFSLVTVSSEEVVWAYAEAFHMEKERQKIRPIGICRTDYFFQKEYYRKAYMKLLSLIGKKEEDIAGKKLVLYAPTFRGKVANAVSPDELDFKKLREELGETYIFLCKHHPFVKCRPIVPEECEGYVWDVTDAMEIEELLLVSHICITDYSSLVFEYSLLERPMLFFAYDLDDYYDWRGFYYPYEELVPGPIVKTTEEVIRCLQDPKNWFDKEQVGKFRQKYMGACDGHATERLLRTLQL